MAKKRYFRTVASGVEIVEWVVKELGCNLHPMHASAGLQVFDNGDLCSSDTNRGERCII